MSVLTLRENKLIKQFYEHELKFREKIYGNGQSGGVIEAVPRWM